MTLNNSQYEDIRKVLDERLTRNEYQQMQRKQEVLTALPQYAVLEEATRSLSMEYTKKLIREKDPDKRSLLKSELAARSEALRKQKEALLSSGGYPADYLARHYTCPICKDTGYVNGKKCSCLKQLESACLYDLSQFHEMLAHNSFANLDEHFYRGEHLDNFRQIVGFCHDYVNNFTEKNYHNILFYGTVGTGKSFLSCCIAKELMDKGYSVLYFSAIQLFRQLSNYTFHAEDHSLLNRFYDSLFTADLLIIDDLGAEKANEFTKPELVSLLDERNLRGKGTIISTNYTLNQLRDTYSERFASRMMENTELCNLTCDKDIRLQIRLENQ